MGNQYFKFKQFLINQDRCAMKVGTDSVLLACFTNILNVKKVLDIGTGTGILSLMLAQQNSDLQIDAIEIDEMAYQQAVENFKISSFKSQINPYLVALQKFNSSIKYDLIITNPPYFISKNNYNINDLQRAKARHDTDLTFDELIEYTFYLLANNGVFNIILPFYEAMIFKKMALVKGFSCAKTINIKAKDSKPVNRVVMSFTKQVTAESTQFFVIYNENNSQTEAYKALTKNYYL